MYTYAQLASSIVTSSIWCEDNPTRILWITMLALKDKNGVVVASIPGLANVARITVAECEAGIAILQAPDKYSKNQENEGRRIEPVDGGWVVLNHFNYRNKAVETPGAIRAKRFREKHKNQAEGVTRNGSNVTPVSVFVDASVLNLPEGESEGKPATPPQPPPPAKPPRTVFTPPTPEEVSAYSTEIGYPLDGGAWCDSYAQKGWMVGKNKMKDWKAAVRNWKSNGWRATKTDAKPKRHEWEIGGAYAP